MVSADADTNAQSLPKLSGRRVFVNALTQKTVALGGIAVIATIALIMGYLIWVVVPMFVPASIEHSSSRSLPTSNVMRVATDDRFEVIAFIRADGAVEFRETDTLQRTGEVQLSTSGFASVKPIFPTSDSYAARTRDDELIFFKITHEVRFDRNARRVVSRAQLLFDESTVTTQGVVEYDVFRSETRLRVATLDANGQITLFEYRDIDDFFELEDPRELRIDHWDRPVDQNQLMFGPRGRWLYQIDQASGQYRLINVASIRRFGVESEGAFLGKNANFVDATPVLGRYSFLVADDLGRLVHWTLRPDETGSGLRAIREFEYDAPILKIATEHRRKGFVAVDHENTAHLGYTTSARQLTSVELNSIPQVVEFSPRADRLVALGNDQVDFYKISNKHPEISWSTLWGRVWFEGYEKPVFSWQSSAADTDFEAKFSLMPLLFGTIKAAFYAMLVATPLAIMGAIYTAVFMSPGMRKWIKPGIEIMAALPTVILGFLAGLWLAPLVETHLTSILLLLLVLPLGVLVFAYLFSLVPNRITASFDGWFGALSVPILVLLAYLTIANDEFLSHLIFGMDAKLWFYEQAGIEYDQRNALIIGIAMGLAVIPTIFAISEDAIYGVPQHLVHGSLALGATRWQTLIRVVLLTASPGVFSAVMIGLGRAVGETMIVLMATGNTPIMDVNLFQGMRTFAANIAVEMPESEVGSTHFRILFLTAFVLFVITFLFNTIAEIVRQRLRTRYGNL